MMSSRISEEFGVFKIIVFYFGFKLVLFNFSILFILLNVLIIYLVFINRCSSIFYSKLHAVLERG